MIHDFDLFSWREARGTGGAPPVSHAELELFLAALGGRRWRTASDLSQATGLNDRKLRALAADSGGRIISGQRGYCLLAEATSDEIAHAADWLVSQGKQMIRRGIAIRRAAHTLIS